MSGRALILLLTPCLACTEPCPDGASRNPDGSCAEVNDGPRWERDTLPGVDLRICTAEAGNGRLDLEAGCADGACADMTKAEIDSALGEAGACDDGALGGSVRCEWAAGGLWATFGDADGDLVPDPDETAGLLNAEHPYSGTTVDGLGLGMSYACWVQAIGEPTRMDLTPLGDLTVPSEMHWDVPNVDAYDWYNSGRLGQDGFVDLLFLGTP